VRGKTLVYGEEVANWVWARVSAKPTTEYAAIGLKGKDIVAGVVYTRYHPGISIEMTVAAESATWAVPGYLRALFAYPFLQLDCQRATAIVAAKNIKSRKLCERVGFVQEGLCRYGFKDDDAVIYGMYKNTCRWVQ
jgi:RimJ/RimL family protein N-acetyltransferase